MTAGTVMRRSHLPLKAWFTATHIVTSHYDRVKIDSAKFGSVAGKKPGKPAGPRPNDKFRLFTAHKK